MIAKRCNLGGGEGKKKSSGFLTMWMENNNIMKTILIRGAYYAVEASRKSERDVQFLFLFFEKYPVPEHQKATVFFSADATSNLFSYSFVKNNDKCIACKSLAKVTFPKKQLLRWHKKWMCSKPTGQDY